jgi:thioredoxin reductase
MNASIDVAIVGAGPYGLSIAAHLTALGVAFRIFGRPMHAWQAHMPAGMHRKSDGSSSDLSDPDGSLTLKLFCSQRGYEHHDTEKPVPLATFVDYGLTFQKRFVPWIEPKLLVFLEKLPNGFRLRFDDGEIVVARRVLLAVGVAPFKHTPEILAGLPPELLSHSSRYGATDDLLGKRIAILGAGASALDLAALLRERGVDALLVARRRHLEFHGVPGRRAIWRRALRPRSGIGNGWRLRIFSGLPQIFHALPERLRRHQAGMLLGPATGWFMKERVVGRVPLLTGRTLQRAAAEGGRVRLTVAGADGTTDDIVVDRVIAATGYRVDLRRLGFMPDELRALIRTEGQAPALSSNFECSVPGLFFVGPVAMNSFGPVVRFVYGARYTAQRLSRHLACLRSGRHQATPNRHSTALAPEIAIDPDLAPP